MKRNPLFARTNTSSRQPKANRPACLLLLSAGFLSSYGCAALSLFGTTHDHTHYHNCDETEVLNNQVQQLESRLHALESGRTLPSQSGPVFMPPVPANGS